MICRKLDTRIIQKHQNEASFHILCMKYLQLNIFRACKTATTNYRFHACIPCVGNLSLKPFNRLRVFEEFW
jgi:hypothetical protein